VISHSAGYDTYLWIGCNPRELGRFSATTCVIHTQVCGSSTYRGKEEFEPFCGDGTCDSNELQMEANLDKLPAYLMVVEQATAQHRLDPVSRDADFLFGHKNPLKR